MKALKALALLPMAMLFLLTLFGGYGLAKLAIQQVDKRKTA